MSGGEIVGSKPAELGFQANDEQAAKILERVKEEAGIREWSLPDDVFADIARQVLGASSGTSSDKSEA